ADFSVARRCPPGALLHPCTTLFRSATDAAGNLSSASAAYSVTVDTSAPSAPSIATITDNVSPVVGTVANGGSSNDTTLQLDGTAIGNATVGTLDTGSQRSTATANKN